jgi:predicted DNA-binding transcriptional regulator AlpA
VSLQKRLYRVREVAELLSVSEKLIWKKIALRQGFDVVRIGRSVRVPSESIERLIQEGTTPARVV